MAKGLYNCDKVEPADPDTPATVVPRNVPTNRHQTQVRRAMADVQPRGKN